MCALTSCHLLLILISAVFIMASKKMVRRSASLSPESGGVKGVAFFPLGKSIAVNGER